MFELRLGCDRRYQPVGAPAGRKSVRMQLQFAKSPSWAGTKIGVLFLMDQIGRRPTMGLSGELGSPLSVATTAKLDPYQRLDPIITAVTALVGSRGSFIAAVEGLVARFCT